MEAVKLKPWALRVLNALRNGWRVKALDALPDEMYMEYMGFDEWLHEVSDKHFTTMMLLIIEADGYQCVPPTVQEFREWAKNQGDKSK